MTVTLELVSEVAPLSSSPSLPAKIVRIPPGMLPGSASSSSKAIGRSKGITKKRISTSSSSTGGVAGIKIPETALPGGDVARIPFREIIKAILHNSGQLNENEDHGNLSCVDDTFKKMGIRFP